MPDPVTNVEIEDVLSSIRKLVSDDSRASAAEPDESDDVLEPIDRFVLTPAHRIEEDVSTDPEPSQDSAAEPLSDADRDDPTDAEERAEDTPETGSFEAEPPAFLLRDRVSEDTEHPETTEDTDGASPPVPDARSALEAKIAALEAAIGRSETEFEPDGSEMQPSSWDGEGWEEVDTIPFMHHRAPVEEAELMADAEGAANANSPVEPAAEDTAQEGPEMAQDSEDRAFAFRDMGAARLSSVQPIDDENTGDEPVASQTENPAEDAAEEDIAPEAGAADAAHLDGASEGDQHEEENEVAMKAALASEDDGGIDDLEALLSAGAEVDEKVLRALVSALVREELQGALGERITRNVRKLVRREIHRVLAANELE